METLAGADVKDAATARAKAADLRGLLILIAKKESKIYALPSQRARHAFSKENVDAIVKTFSSEFKEKEFDQGLADAIEQVRRLAVRSRSTDAAVGVRDDAKLFSSEAIAKADEVLLGVHRDADWQVLIQTIDSLGGQDIKARAKSASEAAKIRGLFILISKDDQKIYALPSRVGGEGLPEVERGRPDRGDQGGLPWPRISTRDFVLDAAERCPQENRPAQRPAGEGCCRWPKGHRRAAEPAQEPGVRARCQGDPGSDPRRRRHPPGRPGGCRGGRRTSEAKLEAAVVPSDRRRRDRSALADWSSLPAACRAARCRRLRREPWSAARLRAPAAEHAPAGRSRLWLQPSSQVPPPPGYGQPPGYGPPAPGIRAWRLCSHASRRGRHGGRARHGCAGWSRGRDRGKHPLRPLRPTASRGPRRAPPPRQCTDAAAPGSTSLPLRHRLTKRMIRTLDRKGSWADPAPAPAEEWSGGGGGSWGEPEAASSGGSEGSWGEPTPDAGGGGDWGAPDPQAPADDGGAGGDWGGGGGAPETEPGQEGGW